MEFDRAMSALTPESMYARSMRALASRTVQIWTRGCVWVEGEQSVLPLVHPILSAERRECRVVGGVEGGAAAGATLAATVVATLAAAAGASSEVTTTASATSTAIAAELSSSATATTSTASA